MGALGARALAVLSTLLLLGTTAPAAARAQMFTDLDLVCAEAVLPLRIATFQSPIENPYAFADWIDTLDFRFSHPLMQRREGWGVIHVVVLVYAGTDGEGVVLEIATADRGHAWRTELLVDPPDPRMRAHTMRPQYLVVDFPPELWESVFPSPGMYTVAAWSARAADGAGSADLCTAEARSWVLIAH